MGFIASTGYYLYYFLVGICNICWLVFVELVFEVFHECYLMYLLGGIRSLCWLVFELFAGRFEVFFGWYLRYLLDGI